MVEEGSHEWLSLKHTLGFTGEFRTGYSEPLYAPARVTDRYHREEGNLIIPIGYVLGSIPQKEEFRILLKCNMEGKEETLALYGEEPYNELRPDDNVTLEYRNILSNKYDFVPPNFEEKTLVESTIVGYQAINAKKS